MSAARQKQRGVLPLLSPVVRERVLAKMKSDGYKGEPDAWLADMLTTASRSPNGYLLRLGKLKGPEIKGGMTLGELFGEAKEVDSDGQH